MIALAFLHTWLLWGLALGSIPIIIHLFHRRKFRTVMWGAMAFLLSSSKLKARRLKILQLLLLLTRILVVLVAVTALARPHLTGALFAGFLSGEKTSSVVLLDNSFSMGAKSGETAFDKAKSAVDEVVGNFRRGDSMTLVTFSKEPRVVVQDAVDKNAFRKVVENTQLSDGSTNISLAISRALTILQEEDTTKREIYLVTDGRKAGWGLDEIAEWQRIDRMLTNMSHPPKIHIIDVGSPEDDNASLSDVGVEAADSSTAGKYDVRFEVQGYGISLEHEPVAGFYIDDMDEELERVQGSEYVNGIATGEHSFTLDDEGFHTGKLELLDADALPNDNTRYYSILNRRGLPLLCVEGTRKNGLFKTCTDLVRIALAPEKDRDGNVILPADYSNVMVPEAVPLSHMYEKNLRTYEAVFLSNAAELSERDYESLKYYVSRGGGLAIFLGDGIDPDHLNGYYDKDEDGFLPARIGSLTGNPSSKEREADDPEYVLSELDYRHPVLSGFEGSEDGDLSLFRFYAYYRMIPDEDNPDVRVLARFNNGDPFIVEKHVGRGKVLMISSEPTLDWSNLGPRPAFLPLMHHIARYLAGDSSNKYNLFVGEEISYPLESSERPVTVIAPNGMTYKVQPELAGYGDQKFPYLSFDETFKAGIYEVMIGETEATTTDEDKPGASSIFLAVNPDPTESDLTPLDPKVMQGMLKSVDLNIIKFGQNFASRIKESRYGKEIWRYLLLSMLALLVTETSLAYMIDKT